MTYLINIIIRIFISFMIIFSLFIFKISASDDCKGYSYSDKCVLKKSECEGVRISDSPLLTKAYIKQCLKYFDDKVVTSNETIKKIDEKSVKKDVTSIETV